MSSLATATVPLSPDRGFSEGNALQLVEEGYTFIDANPDLIEKAQVQFKKIISIAKNLSKGALEFQRPGEHEHDLGVIHRDGKGGADHKFFIHKSHDDQMQNEAILDKVDFAVINELYRQNNITAVAVALELHRQYPELFPFSIITELARSSEESRAYCTNVTRYLYYLAHTGASTDQLQGAKGHYDRSFLTLHMGDVGGYLTAHLPRGEIIKVSPKRGQLLVFFGVKVFAVTRGAIRPLWHGSVIDGSTFTREAGVHFSHVAVADPSGAEYQVTDAADAYRDFKKWYRKE